MKYFIFLILFSFSVFANSKLYFLPKDALVAKNRVFALIESSNKSIDIAMYNFSYKKFAKALVKAKKRGVNIKVYFDKNKINTNNKIFKYLQKNNILCKVLDRKNHLKIALFDNKKLLLGSLNWTKESFKKNYEVLYYTDKRSDTKEAIVLFKDLEMKQ